MSHISRDQVWMTAYAAAIRAGKDYKEATIVADACLNDFIEALPLSKELITIGCSNN